MCRDLAADGVPGPKQMCEHEHTFTALWSHFGPWGEQGVHFHQCFEEDCWMVLIGEGRSCDPKKPHTRKALDAG